MKKNFIFSVLTISLLSSFSFAATKHSDRPADKTYEVKKVLVATYSGVIIPVAAEYMAQAIEKANNEKYDMIVVKLDTPGGLDLSMREIIKKILASKIPVGIYVSPQGARAASAGVFITMASHIAAMSPGTNIGAAHPVMIGAGDFSDMKDGKKPKKNPMEDKVLNDASAYIKSIAQQKGRNVDWAIKAVTKSDSISAQEAANMKVVDFVADDLNDFVKKMNGYRVEGFGIIKVESVTLDYFNKTRRQDFIATITDPNIAMLLMSIGAIGIFIELYNPGLILPGIVGAISMVLGLYSFQTLSANFAGVALILLGFLFFLVEIKVVSYGLLTLGGIVSVILGTVILFKNPGISGVEVSYKFLSGNLAAIILIMAVLAYLVLRAHLRKVSTGIESLAGKKGLVKVALTPNGKVLVEGEIWDAVSLSGEIEKDSEVIVEKVEGFKIKVRKI